MTSENISEVLKNLTQEGKLEPFIAHIRFPHYKNLVPETKTKFFYPVTAIVGVNGSNKSSVLKTLYGSPKHKNLEALWFSTKVDPIAETKKWIMPIRNWKPALNRFMIKFTHRVPEKI